MEADAYKLGHLDAGLGYGLAKESGFWDSRFMRGVMRPVEQHVVEPLVAKIVHNATGGASTRMMQAMRDPAWGEQTAEKVVNAVGRPFQAVGTAIQDTVAGRRAFPGAENPADAMRQFRAALKAQGLTKKGSRSKTAFNKAVAPLLASAVGAALAPEDERARGAMLTGLGMLGAQSALFGRGKAAPVPVAAPVVSKPSFADVGHAAFAEGKDRFKRWLETPAPVVQKAASLAQFKLALDIGGSVPVPGLGGVGMSFKDQRERLPGMSRWVPRSTMERGFDYADQGFDPEAVMDLEADRGSVSTPLTGAALAALGAMKFAPKSGAGGALLAGLGGAGLGSLYHRHTRDTRAREGAEALEGAERERSKFPIRRHAIQTANEATPLAVSRGSGDA